VVEFVLISVLLLMLLFGLLQVALLFYARSVTAAAAADGARYGANADQSPAAGAARARTLIARGLGTGMSHRLGCTGTALTDAGVEVAQVRCAGRISSVFAPIGAFVRIDVAARSVRDQP